MSARDKHNVMIERWLRQVLADPQMRRWADFAVAWVVSCYFNRSTGIAFAAVETYAANAHVDRRAVQRALVRLVDAGHLSRVRGGGRERRNQYRMVVKETAVDGPPFSDQETAVDGPPFSDVNSGPWTQETAVHEPHKQRSIDRPTSERPLKGTSDSPRADARETDSSPDLDSGFEDFWRQFPAKRAKGSARREFEKVVRAGRASADDLVHAAMRYAAAVDDGRAARFIASPARWLKDERWTDQEPAPAERTGSVGMLTIADALYGAASDDDGDEP
jgi:hypothetical protein